MADVQLEQRTQQRLFDSQAQVIGYLKAAAANPEFHWFFNGEPCLDYRKLTPQVAVSCYIHCGDAILLLERSAKVSFPHAWSTVSGYVDKLRLLDNQSDIFETHLLKEFREEIGWAMQPHMQLHYRSPDSVLKPNLKIHFELFTLSVPTTDIAIQLNDEHLNYEWVRLSKLDDWADRLIPGFRSGLTCCGLA